MECDFMNGILRVGLVVQGHGQGNHEGLELVQLLEHIVIYFLN